MKPLLLLCAVLITTLVVGLVLHRSKVDSLQTSHEAREALLKARQDSMASEYRELNRYTMGLELAFKSLQEKGVLQTIETAKANKRYENLKNTPAVHYSDSALVDQWAKLYPR